MKKIIATNNAPAAIGPYSQAVDLNGTLFISGQIPVNPATGEMRFSIWSGLKPLLIRAENPFHELFLAFL